MAYTVTFTSSVLVGGSVRASGSTLSVDDQTARMLVDLGVATASGLTAQTGATAGAFAANYSALASSNTHTAGTKNTFSHSATTAGLNVAPVAGDPSSLADGDVWTNSTANELRARVNGRSFPVNAVKAWVNFNGTGTVAIRASYNVTSVTDNGTGNYTVNFTNAMADANYGVSLAATGFSTASAASAIVISGAASTGAATKTTTALRVLTGYTGANTLVDTAECNVSVLR